LIVGAGHVADSNPIIQQEAAGVAECTQAVIRAVERSALNGANAIVNHIVLGEGCGLDRSSEMLAGCDPAALVVGTLFALQGICTFLITRKVIDVPSLQENLTQRIEHLNREGRNPQAVPLELLRDAVGAMLRERADTEQAFVASRHI